MQYVPGRRLFSCGVSVYDTIFACGTTCLACLLIYHGLSIPHSFIMSKFRRLQPSVRLAFRLRRVTFIAVPRITGKCESFTG